MIHQDNQKNQRGLIKYVINTTIRGRFFEILLDLFIISTAFYIGFWVNSRFQLTQADLLQFVQLLPIALSVTLIVLLAGGIYKDLWQYIGTRNLIRYGITSLVAVTITMLAYMSIFGEGIFDVSLFFFSTITLFLGLALSRSSFRVFDQIYRSTKQELQRAEIYVLIYGTSNESEILLNWLTTSRDIPYKPIGLIDNDPFFIGKEIQGHRIYSYALLNHDLIKKNNIRGIIIPETSQLSDAEFAELKHLAENHGIWMMTPNLEFSPVGARDSA